MQTIPETASLPCKRCICTKLTTTLIQVEVSKISATPIQLELTKKEDSRSERKYLTDKFIIPFAVAVITFLLFKQIDEYGKRRQYSTLGVAIIDSLLEEVNTGLTILKGRQGTPLPVKSWEGMSTVSDEVLLRIIGTSRGVKPVSFKPNEIRIHCKNYFEHMSASWINTLTSNFQQRDREMLVSDAKYLEAAERVKNMLLQCKELLAANESKMRPK